jgi:hypothetical protein
MLLQPPAKNLEATSKSVNGLGIFHILNRSIIGKPWEIFNKENYETFTLISFLELCVYVIPSKIVNAYFKKVYEVLKKKNRLSFIDNKV